MGQLEDRAGNPNYHEMRRAGGLMDFNEPRRPRAHQEAQTAHGVKWLLARFNNRPCPARPGGGAKALGHAVDAVTSILDNARRLAALYRGRRAKGN